MKKTKASKGSNRSHFTDNKLKGLSEKPATYSDLGCANLTLKVYPPRPGFTAKQRRTFIIVRSVDGKMSQTKIGSNTDYTVAQAREACTKFMRHEQAGLGRVNVALADQQERMRGVTVQDVLDDYTEDMRKRELAASSISNYVGMHCRLNLVTGLQAIELTHEVMDVLVLELRGYRKKTGEPLSQNRIGNIYKLLERSFEHARKGTKKIPRQWNMPFDETKLYGPQVCRDTLYSDDEFLRLWNFHPGTYANARSGIRKNTSFNWSRNYDEVSTALQLLMLTGCRKNEIAEARWDELTTTEHKRLGQMPVLLCTEDRTKKRRLQAIPLPPQCVKILAEHHKKYPLKNPSDRIFPTLRERKGTYDLYKQIKNRGVFENSIHDIRRTAGTTWAEMGASEELIFKLLNHYKITSQSSYNHYRYFTEKYDFIAEYQAELEHRMTNTTKTKNILEDILSFKETNNERKNKPPRRVLQQNTISLAAGDFR